MASEATGNLFDAAARCLACTDPTEKLALTRATAAALAAGALQVPDAAPPPAPIAAPGRPARPRLVA
ncbi:MAG: DUF455 domain-containing protein, partial [Rhodanobacteraceae bacterium]|nr:DUF455 domain-containing protein [Rhodanobacteraceae bacterium]